MALIHRWPLTSGSEDVVGGLVTTNNGGVTFDSNGGHFNGSNQWLSFTKTRPASYSMSIWVQPVALDNRMAPFTGSDIVGRNSSVWGFSTTSTSALRVFSCSEIFLEISSEMTDVKYPPGAMTLMAFTFENGNILYYRNMNNVASTVISGYGSGANTVSIGRCGAYNGFYWKGLLADARIYDHALSQSEIDALYAAGPNDLWGADLPLSRPLLPALLGGSPYVGQKGWRV